MLHITNAEADRGVGIRAAYLLIRAKPGTPFYEQLFAKNLWPVERHRPAGALKIPLNLAPQESDGGELVLNSPTFKRWIRQQGQGALRYMTRLAGKWLASQQP